MQEARGRSRQKADDGKRLAVWSRIQKAAECSRRQAVEGGRKQKRAESLQKAECGSRRVVESSRMYEREGGRSLMPAATAIWIFMNLPRIGTLQQRNYCLGLYVKCP